MCVPQWRNRAVGVISGVCVQSLSIRNPVPRRVAAPSSRNPRVFLLQEDRTATRRETNPHKSLGVQNISHRKQMTGQQPELAHFNRKRPRGHGPVLDCPPTARNERCNEPCGTTGGHRSAGAARRGSLGASEGPRGGCLRRCKFSSSEASRLPRSDSGASRLPHPCRDLEQRVRILRGDPRRCGMQA